MLDNPPSSDSSASTSYLLAQLARTGKGLSGRSLRRLPVLALSSHIHSPARPIPAGTWIDGMIQVALDQRKREPGCAVPNLPI